MIDLRDCKDRHVYKINSRNLKIGVFREKTKGFIGIRLKFGNRFLFEEYHWDTGAPYGTTKPIEEIGVLPDSIENKITLKVVDFETKEEVEFDKTETTEQLFFDGPFRKKGWYFVKTGKYSKDIRAVSIENEKLFLFLDELDEK